MTLEPCQFATPIITNFSSYLSYQLRIDFMFKSNKVDLGIRNPLILIEIEI